MRPAHERPLLLSTLCPERWCLSWAVEAGEVKGVRILHHELLNLPKKTLAPDVLEAINDLRAQLREAEGHLSTRADCRRSIRHPGGSGTSLKAPSREAGLFFIRFHKIS